MSLRLRPVLIVLSGILALGACGTEEGKGGGDTDIPTIDHPRKLLGVKDTAIASQGALLALGAVTGRSAGSAVTIQPFGAAVNINGIAYLTLHGDLDAIVRWDFETRTFKDGVTLTGDEPTNVSFSHDGATAYVASQWSSQVDVVNVANDSIIASVPTPGNDPYQTTVSPDDTRFYASGNGDRIWIFNTATRGFVDTIRVDADPNGMVITRDGKWMFVTHLSSGVIGRITLATGVYDTLAIVGATPVHGLDVSPDGTQLYLVSQGTDSLYAFNTTTGANEGQVYAGDEAFGLGATPDGSEIWVTSYTGDLRRFHASDLSTITTLVLGGHLRRLAIDPLGRGAVIADEDGRVIVMK